MRYVWQVIFSHNERTFGNFRLIGGFGSNTNNPTGFGAQGATPSALALTAALGQKSMSATAPTSFGSSFGGISQQPQPQTSFGGFGASVAATPSGPGKKFKKIIVEN